MDSDLTKYGLTYTKLPFPMVFLVIYLFVLLIGQACGIAKVKFWFESVIIQEVYVCHLEASGLDKHLTKYRIDHKEASRT